MVCTSGGGSFFFMAFGMDTKVLDCCCSCFCWLLKLLEAFGITTSYMIFFA